MQVRTVLENPTRYHVIQKQKNQVRQYLSESFHQSGAWNNQGMQQQQQQPSHQDYQDTHHSKNDSQLLQTPSTENLNGAKDNQLINFVSLAFWGKRTIPGQEKIKKTNF